MKDGNARGKSIYTLTHKELHIIKDEVAREGTQIKMGGGSFQCSHTRYHSQSVLLLTETNKGRHSVVEGISQNKEHSLNFNFATEDDWIRDDYEAGHVAVFNCSTRLILIHLVILSR